MDSETINTEAEKVETNQQDTETKKSETFANRKENDLIREEWTVDGPVEVRWKEGQEVKIPPMPTMNINLIPGRWKQVHSTGLYTIRMFYDVVAQQKGRQLPMFQSDILQHVPKKVFRALEMQGLIKTRLLQLQEEGRPIGGRMLCWLTPEGKYFSGEIKKKTEAAKAAIETAQKAEMAAAPQTQETP